MDRSAGVRPGHQVRCGGEIGSRAGAASKVCRGAFGRNAG